MKKPISGRPFLVAICAMFALMLGASAATAAQATFTVSAGSAPDNTVVSWSASTVGSSPHISFTNVTRNIPMTCETGSADGTATAGPSQPGTGIATIDAADFVDCEGLNLPLDVVDNTPWQIDVVSESAGVADGAITNVDAEVRDSATGGDQCKFRVIGSVPATYDNGTQELTTDGTAADLTIKAIDPGNPGDLGSLCSLVMADGDAASYGATYEIVADNGAHNPITITQD